VTAQTKNGDTISNPLESFNDLLKRAQNGDTSTLPELWRAFEDPKLVESYGNLARQAERSFIELVAVDNLGFKEALTRKMEILRAELGGPNPTPIERLLVERVVACWLQVQDADIRYAQAKNQSVKWYEYCQRRMNHSHKRYLSALKALALVRKLAVPVLQVNIAKKQINVAGPVVGKLD
jgi:hypothetical protein